MLFEHAPAMSELTMDEGEDVLFDQRECERDAIIEAAEIIGGHSFDSYTSLLDNITGTPLQQALEQLQLIPLTVHYSLIDAIGSTSLLPLQRAHLGILSDVTPTLTMLNHRITRKDMQPPEPSVAAPLVAYTDASVAGDLATGAIAAPIVCPSLIGFNVAGHAARDGTMHAELCAILLTLALAPPSRRIIIYADNESAVELMKQLINQSDTEFNAFPPYPWLRTLACALLLDRTARTSVRWIKAHDRRAGNCLADRVAAQAMESDPPPPPPSLEEATMHALSDLALRKVAWSHPMAPRALFAWKTATRWTPTGS